jgi:hypothetical protein
MVVVVVVVVVVMVSRAMGQQNVQIDRSHKQTKKQTKKQTNKTNRRTEDDGREHAVEEELVVELGLDAPDILQQQAGAHADEHADGRVWNVGCESQEAGAPHVLVLGQGERNRK